MRVSFTANLLALALAVFGMSGCTVWGARNPPTLKSTTSAEQYERIFWGKVKAGDWNRLASLLAPNVVYVASGKTISRDRIVPYLRSQKIRDFVITEMAVLPNGPDMTLSYKIQLSPKQGPAQSLIALSVWQQLRGGWVLIVHSQQPD